MRKVKIKLTKELVENVSILFIALYKEDGTPEQCFSIRDVSDVSIEDYIDIAEFIKQKPKISR